MITIKEVRSKNEIIAVVALKSDKEKVSGGLPIFFVENEQEQEKTGMLLARITLGMVHDLGNGLKIIIRH